MLLRVGGNCNVIFWRSFYIMVPVAAIVLSVLINYALGAWNFPPGFKFGASTSSYQIEGAWNVSDKSANIWDTLTHTHPNNIANGDNGDIACDSYNKWREDIQLAVDLGLHFYRFSLSWSRILPTGLPDKISEDGVKYYNNLIDGLLENGIEPMLTLYHWDLPQRLQDLGGWTNPLSSNWFADYANIAYSLYGDRVKIWITINEPLMVCDTTYNDGRMAPGVRDPGVANYLCNKHTLIAHAKAWRVYDEKYRPMYKGKVSLTNALLWYEPENEGDEELADLVNELCTGMYSHPIFTKQGGWPPRIEKIISEYSKKQGFPYSTLPAFTKAEIDLMRGTHDFYAFNYYISRIVRKSKIDDEIIPWPFGGPSLLNAVSGYRPEWKTTSVKWFTIFAEGLRKLSLYLKKHYGDLEYLITENGLASNGYQIDDTDRVEYLRDHLEQILLAIKDGVNITHYTVWTLIDNFEWLDGYNTKFGLYEVDFNSPARTRTPRSSAQYYKNVILSHSLQEPLHRHSEL